MKPTWATYIGPVEGKELQTTLQTLGSIVTPEHVSTTNTDRFERARDQSSHTGHPPDLVV